jgi:hypothetical protein
MIYLDVSSLGGNDRIGHSCLGRCQVEPDPVISDLSRQHKDRYCVALAIETATFDPGIVITGHGEVEVERHRLRVNGRPAPAADD